MTGFPADPPPTDPGDAADWRPAGRVAHVFTHFGLTLEVLHAEAKSRPEGLWWPVADLHEAGLPTLFRKVAGAVYK